MESFNMLHIIIILKYKELLLECKSICLIELIVSSHDIRNYIFFASAMAYTYTQRIYVFQEKGSISESRTYWKDISTKHQ